MSRPVRAMVMAAGAGTRLRPLTRGVPKPMIPVADRPVLEYSLLNLKRHGITDIVLNLHAFPEQIKTYFGDGSRFGLRLQYSHEPELLGTAGGVKNVESFLNGGTFLIMSGDGLTDVNLTRLLAFHRQKRALATMALAPVDTRFEYGVTLTAASGRITRFVEKPGWGDVFSNTVNTGIYVFEPAIFKYIPKGRMYDFGKQVWPDLLKRRAPIFAWKTDAYWCDIGSLTEYRRAQGDVLAKRSRFRPHVPERRRGIWAPRSMSLQGLRLEGPCLIGEDCRIARGVRLGPGTVLGRGVRIEAGAELQHCIVWDHAYIGKNVFLADTIVTQHATVTASGSTLHGGIVMKK